MYLNAFQFVPCKYVKNFYVHKARGGNKVLWKQEQ